MARRTMRCSGVSGNSVGNIAYLPDARRFEPGAVLLRQPGQLVDAVVGSDMAAGAMRVVRARVGVEAMAAGRDVRCGGRGEHRLHLAYAGADGVEERLGPVRHRVQPEESVEVEPRAVVNILPVQGKHTRLAHVEPGAAQHPELDGGIEDEDVLEPGCRFDFRQAPAAAGQALDDIGADQDAPMPERRLEQGRRGSGLQHPARFLERLPDMAVIVRHEMAAANAPARQFPDLVPGLEDRLERLIGRRRQIAPIAVVPEPQMALRSGNVAGLGEGGFPRHSAFYVLRGSSSPACLVHFLR